MTDHPETPPFQKHRIYYIVLKLALLAAALFLALRFFGKV